MRENIIAKAVTAEKPHPHARAAGGKSFLAPQGGKNGSAGIFIRPDTGKARSPPCRPLLMHIARRRIGWCHTHIGGRWHLAHINAVHQAADLGIEPLAPTQGHRAAQLAGGVNNANFRPVIILVKSARANMRVGGTNQPEFIRVSDTRALQGKAAQIGFAHIRPVLGALVPRRDLIRHDFEACKFIARRQKRVCFGGAFHLRHFDNRLVTHTQIRIALRDRLPVIGLVAEHETIRPVGIMRDRDAVHALIAQAVHPAPQIFRISRNQPRIRLIRCTIGKHHIAVQVFEIILRRGVFITRKGGKLAGVVMALSGGDNFLPGRTDDIHIQQVIFHNLAQIRHH